MSRRQALVVGVSEHCDSRLAALRKPGADVAELARVLRDPKIGGFDEVLTLTNAPADTLRREIAKLFHRKHREDLLVLYFSGHGLKDERGQLYLAAHDTDKDLLRGTAISAADISSEMNASRSRRQVLVLDCCYSGAFEGTREAQGSIGTARAFAGHGFGRVVLTATDSVELSWEDDAALGETEASVFTHFLVEGLESGEADANGDGWIGLGELYDYVYERVISASPRQTPGMWTYRLQGEIYLARNIRHASHGMPPQVPPAVAAPARWTEGSPYRGLQVFEREHAPIFRGRDTASDEVVAALSAQALAGCAFVLILGRSGGGKSSLARAGVLPRLLRPGAIEGVDHWRSAIVRPGAANGDPILALAQALLRPGALPELRAADTTAHDLARIFRDTPQAGFLLVRSALSEVAQAAQEAGAAPSSPRRTRLVLLVDQLEEIFTADGMAHDDRECFAAVLAVLARSGRVWILATLRSDFYARVVEIELFLSLKSGDGQYDLREPTAAEIGQMIRQPAIAAGLAFEEDPDTGEPLDDLLRDAAVTHPSVLPLLEFALQELEKRKTGEGTLTYAAYAELGGFEGALARRAEEELMRQDPETRAAWPRVMRDLVTVAADGSFACVDASGIDTSGGGMGDPARARLLETFVEARLMVGEHGDDGAARVRLAHEALLEHWPRLRELLAAEREALRVRARVETAAARWREDGASADLLLPQGKPLVEAEELARDYGTGLAPPLRRYIDASLARSRRLARVRRAVGVALVVLSLAAGIAAWVANAARRDAVDAAQRAQIRERDARQVSGFLFGLFEGSDPNQAQGREVTAGELLERGARQLDQLAEQPEIQTIQQGIIGSVYRALGDYAAARPLLESALTRRRELFGEMDLRVAESARELAILEERTGAIEPAAGLYLESLEIRRTRLGPDSAEIAESLVDLGTVHYLRGDLGGAESLYRESLEMRRRLFGESHVAVAESLESLAVVEVVQGRFEEAEDGMRAALEIRRPVLGEHLDVAHSLANLGAVLYYRGRYADARPVLEEALDLHRRFLGVSHLSVAQDLDTLALVLTELGDLAAAEPIYRESLAILETTVGFEHPARVPLLNNLARLLLDLGRPEEAAGHLRAAVAVFEAGVVVDPATQGRVLENLGRALLHRGELAAAEEQIQASLELRRRELGERHPDVGVSFELWARLEIARGNFEAAVPLLEDALSRFKEAFPGGHHWVDNAEELLDSLHRGEAEEWLKEERRDRAR